MNLPTGTVTFLFTDIEGSTKLWEQHPEAMQSALAHHDTLLRHAIETHGGVVFKTIGDAFCAAFTNAPDALDAAIDAQRLLNHGGHGERRDSTTGDTGSTGILEPLTGMSTVNSTVIDATADQTLASSPQAFPVPPVVQSPFSVPSVVNNAVVQLKVRMALHTGVAEERDGDYFGPPLNRVARLLAIGHGGQVLLSQATRDLLPLEAPLTDKRTHQLKDLEQPEHVYQLTVPDLPSDFPPLRSLHHTNLPSQATSFIGRQRELEDVNRLLFASRLLTLTGTGGCGKTRLALQVAAEVVESFPGGVWLVELAALSDPSLVMQTVANTLGLRDESGRSLTETLTNFLKSKSLLLLLDNCEHVVETCATLAELLLRSCPHVKVLATSREPLHVPGERVWRVPSLLPPDLTSLSSEENDISSLVSENDAVRLFMERAGAHRADFRLTSQNAGAVAQVCDRLDGIPLAIELAAARVRSMSVEQIAQRMDDRFRLLTGGSRTAQPRQQTLQSLIDWSYHLLTETERVLLRRLSVFVGGWTLEAAEIVVSGQWSVVSETAQAPPQSKIEDWQVLDVLSSLVDKSLIVYQEKAEGARYRFMESIREYARDRLTESSEEEQMRNQHLAYFVSFSEMVRRQLVGAEQQQWMERLEADHDNLRAAMAWCEKAEEGGVAGLRLTASLWKFWDVRGYWHEGLASYRSALAHPGVSAPTPERADALQGLGMFLRNQSDYPAAREAFEESLRIRTELGNRSGIAQALNNIGAIDVREGDYGQARTRYETSLAIRTELGDRVGMAACLLNLGVLAQETGENEAAFQYYTDSLTLCKEVGDQANATILLTNMGNVALGQGHGDQARSYYEESLAIARQTEDKFAAALALVNLGPLLCTQGDYLLAPKVLMEAIHLCEELGEKRLLAYALEGFGRLATMQKQYRRAARLFGAADRLRETLTAPLAPTEQAEHASYVEMCRDALGAVEETHYRTEGQAWSLEQTVRYALSNTEETTSF